MWRACPSLQWVSEHRLKEKFSDDFDASAAAPRGCVSPTPRNPPRWNASHTIGPQRQNECQTLNHGQCVPPESDGHHRLLYTEHLNSAMTSKPTGSCIWSRQRRDRIQLSILYVRIDCLFSVIFWFPTISNGTLADAYHLLVLQSYSFRYVICKFHVEIRNTTAYRWFENRS